MQRTEDAEVEQVHRCRVIRSTVASALVTGTLVAALACNAGRATVGASTDELAGGTWGGENAGIIVSDTVAHVHIGCTFGNFRVPVALADGGRFNVAGSYTLRAFPIVVGPSLPAVFSGVVSGTRLTISVAVNDTVEKRPVALGPVTVVLGREPRMGPCPICRRIFSGV